MYNYVKKIEVGDMDKKLIITLKSYKFKLSKLEPSDINRDILLILAHYEKYIFKQGFTKRVIIGYKRKEEFIYRAYYYNVLTKVHLYLEINPNDLTQDINFIFFTLYKNGEFVTYNNSYIEIEDSSIVHQNIEKFSKAKLEELYQLHLNNRKKIKDEMIEGRLVLKNLLKNRPILNKKVSKKFLKLLKNEDKSFEDKLEDIDKELENSLNIKQSSNKKFSKMTIFIGGAILVVILVYGGYYLFNKYKSSQNSTEEKITNIDKELYFFNKRVKSYKKVTLNLSSAKYLLEDSFKDIDKYLKNSKIHRSIGNPIDATHNRYISSCQFNKDIIKLYKWHNGIEKLLPNISFYKINDIYKDGKYIVLFGDKSREKLAINCNNNGIYLYNKNTKKFDTKIFYSINHFFKVLSDSYSKGAIYDKQNSIKIDKKLFDEIYINHLTSVDKERYNDIIEYIKNRAVIYATTGNRELKLALLNAIDKLKDKKLKDSVMIFLNDKDNYISSKAKRVLLNLDSKESIF